MQSDKSLLHDRRQVIRFNARELKALDEYCRRFRISSPRSVLLRKMIMERVLNELDRTNPTLF